MMIKALAFAICATIGVDYAFSEIQDTSFYLSESLLFSSYWLLFPPLMHLLWRSSSQKPLQGLFHAGLATGIHLLLYPVLIAIISFFFFNHTFAYGQTFDYGITSYSIKTFIVYGLSLPVIALFRSEAPPTLTFSTPQSGTKNQDKPGQYFADVASDNHDEGSITTLLVPDSYNTKTRIETKDISCFYANPPYVSIHHPVKKYLLTETLRSLEKKLAPEQFMRIHKSCIVNIEKVISCRSRLNGDYDLELYDGTSLRLSRNYAANFKARFHRHTTN